MNTIDKWDDLAAFGIIPLTAESCGLGYRLLCDLTERGKHILEKCLGLAGLGAQPAWNRGSAAAPHIGSVMLAYPLLTPRGVRAARKRLHGGVDHQRWRRHRHPP